MRINPLVFLILFVSLSCFWGVRRCEAQKLAQNEVEGLKRIGLKLKKQWNFSVDPCSQREGWLDKPPNKDIANNLTCTCSLTVCHVTSIQLKSQNLTGELPPELANLTQLKLIDLSRNYLNGSIPASWASLPLTNISLLGNRIFGKIPDELGNISTLMSLVLEDNQMAGPIPASLGKLTNLSRLFLSGNNFSGKLPESLGNLNNMVDLRLDGNPISGKIPNFVSNWTQLQRIDLQGTYLEGPFPPNFINLSSITELRISDLKGVGEFPPLHKMKGMNQLVLRNLSLAGQIPAYIGHMPLKALDLSFNNLSGSVPSSLQGLQSTINFMSLSNNKLQGEIPNWILSSKDNLDLSYNNFTGHAPNSCPEVYLNLVSSFSSVFNPSILTCFRRNLPCSVQPRNYNFSINCGGSQLTIEGNEYEGDTSPQGAASYYPSRSGKWAYNSAGFFVGNEKGNYIASNVSVLNVSNPEMYMGARLSPLSLRYNGLCLQKGNYTVNLHFAEIMFMDNQTFFSVGRRIFDVSIQGQKVLQDFDIAKEANGNGKEIVKSFTTLVDSTGTLEIHFYWAGKGTKSVPVRGVYGPLISAISVRPNFTPETFESEGKKKLSVGDVLGIVLGTCAVMLFLSVILWVCLRKNAKQNELRGLDIQTSIFSLKQIKAATNNFNPGNKIGEGGFGPVYKGILPNGTVIAVKQLSSKSKQGNREFLNEVGMISALQHTNLVKLYGCCIEGNQLLLIYEYMENNSLARALFGPETSRLKLDWQTRRNICTDIVRGLIYLHEESRLKIVHRDIKATNILLDKDLTAKISDFGLAKLDEEENSHISTRIAGTIGYMAPEYAMRGYLTYKADVYSFGVVMLEIISGSSNASFKPKEDDTYLLDWVYVLEEQGRLLELVDPSLGSNYSKEEALLMLNVAVICTNQSPSLRPTMSMVMSMLDSKMPVKPGTSSPDFLKFENISHDSQTHSISTDGPQTEPSISGQSRTEETLLLAKNFLPATMTSRTESSISVQSASQ